MTIENAGKRVATMGLVLFWVLGFASASTALASEAGPGWAVDSVASPTNFSVTGNFAGHGLANEYRAEIRNNGSQATDGSSVTITDVLPKGVTAESIGLFKGIEHTLSFGDGLAPEAGCAATAGVVKCELPAGEDSTLLADEKFELIVEVAVEPAEIALTNTVKVSGGGAVEGQASGENHISSTAAGFGFANFDFDIAGKDGAHDSQAGDHPYELTTTIDLNSTSTPHLELAEDPEGPTSLEEIKDVVVDLPLGFAGSTLAAPRCTLAELSSAERCPHDTQVGHIFSEPHSDEQVDSPVWNLVPERGVVAEFGFIDGERHTHVLHAQVTPSPAGYVVQVISPDIAQIALGRIVTTFYGEPALRDQTGGTQIPFFTNPSDCTDAKDLEATIYIDSWQRPGSFNADGSVNTSDPNWKGAVSKSPPVTGCDELSFSPELSAQPLTAAGSHAADSPAGLNFALKVPQPEKDGVLATPSLRNATVTFPAGMTVDPSAGSGLQACSEAQIGWHGRNLFDFDQSQPQCPGASKIGTLEIESPSIPGVLQGAIYLAAQNENPFASTLAAYIVVDDPLSGVLVKIAGEIKTDPTSGQLTSRFPETAQLPFSALRLHLFDGSRASLATPESCGTFTTTSKLLPWSSAPGSGPEGTPFSSFEINTGCVSGFAPTFAGGTSGLQAGAFTPFVTSFSRADTDQEIGGLTLTMPPGLEADIANVPECPEAQANAGTCPESTQIGTVQSEAGPGPTPLVNTGKVYFTGPYNGGAFGLSVVVPAVAGPYNFGNVVVRQSLRIDPYTAQVTDVSDPFPTILDPTGVNGQTDGIPIRLRRVNVEINRPNFTLNPTSCAKLQLTATITSTQNSSSALASPFQVANCASLKFAPKFTASTSGKTSRTDGASLTTTLTYPNAPPGTYANIARVKVDLPLQLPSRLTTLHKACTLAQFNLNPAGCPAESMVGHAVAHTPLLPVPLTGPAIFVSHGGEAFPSLTMVLQGDGVTINLVGSTFVKKGITSTTFKTLPDTPVSSFQLTLPEGPYSALAATANLCKSKLAMPTAFVAQNGTEKRQTTPIAVSGCGKTLTNKQKLARALTACHKKYNHSKQAACVRTAKKRYQKK